MAFDSLSLFFFQYTYFLSDSIGLFSWRRLLNFVFSAENNNCFWNWLIDLLIINSSITCLSINFSIIINLSICVRTWVACVAGGIVWMRDWSFGGWAVFQKKGVGTRRLKYAVFLSRGFAASDGSAVKSHSTILQRLRRQISLDYYTIPPGTQARTCVVDPPPHRGFA